MIFIKILTLHLGYCQTNLAFTVVVTHFDILLVHSVTSTAKICAKNVQSRILFLRLANEFLRKVTFLHRLKVSVYMVNVINQGQK